MKTIFKNFSKFAAIFFTAVLLSTTLLFANEKTFSGMIQQTAPYYGTAAYPYWGKYVKTPFSAVTAAPWINTDGVVIGWDWSLPTFVKAPKKSGYSFTRVFNLSSSTTTTLNTLQPPNFVCKPTVQHWVNWKDLEPTKNNFTFTQLISNINLSYSKGYSSIVRIHSSATTFAPTWVNTLEGAPILPKEAGAMMQNYDIKDPRFHARYLKLVEAIGKSGIPHMNEVVGLYVGYASKSNGDEGIGPYHNTATGNDTVQHVRERLDAWANITDGVRGKVFMGGVCNYGFAKGFGIRRGFVEMYLYHIPSNDIGQLVDSNGYLYVDETNPIISTNLFHGEENEEYEEKWATASNDFRFGTSTESFPYRYFTSNLRLLQMRCNEVLYNPFSLMPEMSAWIGQELGCTIDEAPDVWSFLRESYIKPSGGITVKNFERWLYQRDSPGYTTVPAVKINQAIQMWMVQSGKYYDYIAREGKKIGFNIEKNWNGVKDSLAFKISLMDYNAGTLNLKYSNGTELVTLTKPLLGDSLLKTYTFFVKDYKNGANIGGKFDFTLEAGDNTKSIIVSFVRVVQAVEQAAEIIPTTSVSISGCPSAAIAVNGTCQLSATVLPSNATNKTVSWSSSNTSVATVSITGLVTVKTPGSSIITATTQDGNFKADYTVTVYEPTIAVTGISFSPNAGMVQIDSSKQLMPIVTPSNASNKTVKFTSNLASVAIVDSLTGMVTGKTPGSAIITATTQDGNFKADFTVTIPEPLTSIVSSNYLGETLKVFPVPASDKLNITLAGGTKLTSYTITDLSGKIQSKSNFGEFKGDLSIDVSNLNGGYYILQLNFGNFVQSGSFIKR